MDGKEQFTKRVCLTLAKHFARSGEIEPALRLHLSQSRQNIVSAVDIGAHGGETIGEAFAHKALSAQVIAFIKLLLGENVKDAGVALQTGRMEVDAVQTTVQAAETLAGLLERDASNQSMHLIAPNPIGIRQDNFRLARMIPV